MLREKGKEFNEIVLDLKRRIIGCETRKQEGFERRKGCADRERKSDSRRAIRL